MIGHVKVTYLLFADFCLAGMLFYLGNKLVKWTERDHSSGLGSIRRAPEFTFLVHCLAALGLLILHATSEKGFPSMAQIQKDSPLTYTSIGLVGFLTFTNFLMGLTVSQEVTEMVWNIESLQLFFVVYLAGRFGLVKLSDTGKLIILAIGVLAILSFTPVDEFRRTRPFGVFFTSLFVLFCEALKIVLQVNLLWGPEGYDVFSYVMISSATTAAFLFLYLALKAIVLGGEFFEGFLIGDHSMAYVLYVVAGCAHLLVVPMIMKLLNAVNYGIVTLLKSGSALLFLWLAAKVSITKYQLALLGCLVMTIYLHMLYSKFPSKFEQGIVSGLIDVFTTPEDALEKLEEGKKEKKKKEKKPKEAKAAEEASPKAEQSVPESEGYEKVEAAPEAGEEVPAKA